MGTETPGTYEYGPDFWGFWNTNIDKSRSNYFDKSGKYYSKYGEYVDLLNKWAANYPSFRKKLIANGFMRPDGSLDYSKMLNKDYLQTVDRALKESTMQQSQSARQGMAAEGQKRGGIQVSPLDYAANQSFANAQREAVGRYADQYQQESGRAEQRGNMLTQKDFEEEVGKMRAEIEAKGADVNLWASAVEEAYKIAAQQSPGILQDFNKLMELVSGITDIVGGIATTVATEGAGAPAGIAMGVKGASKIGGAFDSTKPLENVQGLNLGREDASGMFDSKTMSTPPEGYDLSNIIPKKTTPPVTLGGNQINAPQLLNLFNNGAGVLQKKTQDNAPLKSSVPMAPNVNGRYDQGSLYDPSIMKGAYIPPRATDVGQKQSDVIQSIFGADNVLGKDPYSTNVRPVDDSEYAKKLRKLLLGIGTDPNSGNISTRRAGRFLNL